MPLSWNAIRDRSLKFNREWSTETSEDAEAKSFWDGFFNVFGITRRRVASCEQSDVMVVVPPITEDVLGK